VAREAIEPSRTGARTSLQGQVAIVTGAGQGIGRAAAQMLADAGADIVINHFGAPAVDVEELTRSITQAGQRVIAIEADVANRTEVANMVELAAASSGGSTFS
jgi:NAD(P)-dependent dehydrogenase (short-subunit alcohol dehydrogenase family)